MPQSVVNAFPRHDRHFSTSDILCVLLLPSFLALPVLLLAATGGGIVSVLVLVLICLLFAVCCLLALPRIFANGRVV